jgi:putative ABC transport system substrate-binding protein
MRRRKFITLLGATAAWPLATRAQQPERMRHIGVLLPATADDAVFQDRVGAFLQGLQQSGWSIGRNVRIDTRWATANAVEIRRHAAELAALAPDVILAHGASTVGPMLQATRTVPIVFPVAVDPVGAGFVDSLARPGGNATGFMNFEYSLSGKWPELLKEIAPGVTRVAILRDPTQPAGTGQLGAIQAVAPSLRMEVSPVSTRDAAYGTNLVAMAKGAGIKNAVSVNTLSTFTEAVHHAFASDGPHFILAEISRSDENVITYPRWLDDADNRYRFMRYVEALEGRKLHEDAIDVKLSLP